MKDQLDKEWRLVHSEYCISVYRATDGTYYLGSTREEVDIEIAWFVITLSIEDIILRRFGYSLSVKKNAYDWQNEHDVFFGLENDRLGSAMLVLEKLMKEDAPCSTRPPRLP